MLNGFFLITKLLNTIALYRGAKFVSHNFGN